jgi:hypothetical protein
MGGFGFWKEITAPASSKHVKGSPYPLAFSKGLQTCPVKSSIPENDTCGRIINVTFVVSGRDINNGDFDDPLL